MTAIASRCPKCEYARRSAGKPVDLGEGLWRCTQCNGTWRDIVGVAKVRPAQSATHATGQATMQAEAVASEAPADFADTLAALRRKTGRRAADMPKTGTPESAGWAFKFAGAAAAVIGGWLGMAALGAQWQIADLDLWGKRDALELSVTGADRIADAEQGTVQVRGRITNRSGERRSIDALEVVIRDADGKSMGGWRFVPALQHLDPGQTIRFSSAKGGVPALAQGVEIRFATAVQRIALGTLPHADRPRQENRGPVQPGTDRPEES